jgi:hypothetical protein
MTAKNYWPGAVLLGNKKPITAHRIVLPAEIQLDGDQLHWNEMPLRKEILKQPRSPHLVQEFISLADRDAPDDVLYFAKKWGPLHLCKDHNLPTSHSQTIATNKPACRPRGSFPEYWEPIDTWFRMARYLRHLLNIASRLHEGERGDPKDWDHIPGPEPKSNLREHKWRLAIEVNSLLKIGDVGLEFSWRSDPKIAYSPFDLFGHLALQVMMVVSRTDGLAVCSNCSDAYIPKRRPNPNRRHYCSNCGRHAAWRDAKRAQRQRNNGG